MALDVLELMRGLGFERFFVCGHDRGGRVAHRLALDHPQRRARARAARHLADADDVRAHDDGVRAALLPLVLLDPAGAVAGALDRRRPFVLPAHRSSAAGAPKALAVFDARALAEYERCFADPAAIHAMCEDYRAAATIDLAHDRADAERRIACPVRALWGERGVVHRLFAPVADWQAKCALEVTGRALPTGHYIPEEAPDLLADGARSFLCNCLTSNRYSRAHRAPTLGTDNHQGKSAMCDKDHFEDGSTRNTCAPGASRAATSAA